MTPIDLALRFGEKFHAFQASLSSFCLIYDLVFVKYSLVQTLLYVFLVYIAESMGLVAKT